RSVPFQNQFHDGLCVEHNVLAESDAAASQTAVRDESVFGQAWPPNFDDEGSLAITCAISFANHDGVFDFELPLLSTGLQWNAIRFLGKSATDFRGAHIERIP